MSLKDTILKAVDIENQVENVPEWDVNVEVRGLSGKIRAKLITEHLDKDGRVDSGMYPALLCEALYDPKTGKLIFSKADYDALMNKSGAVLERLAAIAMKLSGIGKDADEGAEKNLSETPK